MRHRWAWLVFLFKSTKCYPHNLQHSSKSCCHWLDIENNIYKMTSCTDKKNATVLGKMFKRSRTTYRQGCMMSNMYTRFWWPVHFMRLSYMRFGQNTTWWILSLKLYFSFFFTHNTIMQISIKCWYAALRITPGFTTKCDSERVVVVLHNL